MFPMRRRVTVRRDFDNESAGRREVVAISTDRNFVPGRIVVAKLSWQRNEAGLSQSFVRNHDGTSVAHLLSGRAREPETVQC